MAEEEKKGPKLMPDLDFGTYLAFFLPGALGLYALVPVSPQVHLLFSQLMMKDGSLGASVALLIGGLTVGTIISGIRTLLLDSIGKPDLDYGRLREPDTLAAYSAAIEAYYRFYQFYGNIALAIAFYLLARYLLGAVDYRNEKPLAVIACGVLILLSIQAFRQLRATYRALEQVLGLKKVGFSIEPPQLPNGKVGQRYKCPLKASGGTSPIKWAQPTDTLPDGLILDACGGLAGTPTKAGPAQIALKATDAEGHTDTKEFSITIDPVT